MNEESRVADISTSQEENTGGIFNSFEEIISDEVFINFVKKNVNELRKKRHERPHSDFYYKRNWYDRIRDDHGMNSKFFIDNIVDVWRKRSSLSSEIRSVVKGIGDKSLMQTLLHYSREDSNEIVSQS